jgi:hypothetical protein
MSLYWILLALQCLDIGTTWYALERVSGAYEANPVMRWLFERVGLLPALLGTKAAFMAGVYYLQPDPWGLVVVILVYVGVVGHNVRNIIRSKK